MKKFVAVTASAILLAACSETSGPVSQPNLTPRMIVGPSCPAGADCMDFNTSISSSGGSSFTGTGSSTTSASPSDASDRFLGRFTNEIVTLNVQNVGTSVTLNLDLYIIGTWDGSAGHKYGPDTWQAAAYCGSTPTGQAYTFSFANKKTTKQSFPNQLGGTLNGGMTGSYQIGALGYGSTDQTLVTNHAVSSYDVEYRFPSTGVSALTFTNSCGGTELNIVFSSPSQQLQSTFDESWGLDNVEVIRN